MTTNSNGHYNSVSQLIVTWQWCVRSTWKLQKIGFNFPEAVFPMFDELRELLIPLFSSPAKIWEIIIPRAQACIERLVQKSEHLYTGWAEKN